MRLFRRSATPQSAARNGRPGDPGTPAPHVQICAHTDDDLYFMTPDLLHTVRAGIPVVSVYLTTGEADGINLAMDDPARKHAKPDYPGYTAARQHGIRAAYADMTTGNRHAPWTCETLSIHEGVTAEINTLDDGRITLIFLNLRTCVALPDDKVLHLWAQQIEKLGTLRPTGSPIPEKHDGRPLTRDGVIHTLTDILRAYQPSVVRIMNPDPARTAYNATTDTVTYCDNSDHTAAALFAMAALRQYERETPDHRPAVESYAGYCNKLQPDNLSATAAAEKFRYLAIYGGEDGHDCLKNPGECGDRPLGNRAFNRYYGQSTTHRWRPSTNWLHLRGDGRLTAFAVLGGRPQQWTQDTPDSTTWTGPHPLGTWPDDETRCLARLDTVRDGNGRLHLFALRAQIATAPEGHRRETMHLRQGSPDGEFGTWNNLGSPHDQHNPDRRRAVGMPVATVTASGQPMLLLRNFGTGLSVRNASPQGWGQWRDLHGGILDGATALTCAGAPPRSTPPPQPACCAGTKPSPAAPSCATTPPCCPAPPAPSPSSNRPTAVS
ncbi:PIG-L family deacetylase [Streptomyces sp. NPDC090442]|uniref:PIG-L family deacetylase n=1 Tax=Streptomyces sp. NPDC090442 TaxID=3365962 RepID=UPI0038044578